MTNSIFGTSASSNRVTGMMSGLDTDTLVKGMTGSILSKLSKLQQSRTLLQWKTDAYQSISSQMIDFSGKYLSYSSTSNALTDSFYNCRSVTAKGDSAGAITVSGYSSSADKLSITNILSTARTASFVSRNKVSDAKIKTDVIDFTSQGKKINNLAGETITISYGGETYSFHIDDSFTGTTDAEVALAVNEALAKVKIDDTKTLADKIEMKVDSGDLVFGFKDINEDTTLIILDGTNKSLEAIGLTKLALTGQGTPPITCGVQAGDIEGYVVFNDVAAGQTMTFDLNGTKKTITLPEYTTEAEFLTKLNAEFTKAFGTGAVTASLDGGRLVFETVEPTSKLAFVAADTGLTGFKGVLGCSVGLSNRVIQTQAVGEIPFETDLELGVNDLYEITVNGYEFEFDKEQSLSEILNIINSSEAGVKIEYLETTNSFSVVSTVSGANGDVQITDVEGNLAKVLFGTQGTDYDVITGRDAQIEISYDGVNTTVVTRTSNVFDIDGLVITLASDAKLVDGKPITFQSNVDADDLVKKIVDMIDAFNAISKLSNTEVNTKRNRDYMPLTDEQRADMSESQIALWEEKAKAGMLFGDSILRGMNTDLRFAFSFSVPGVGAISDFGITTSKYYEDYGQIVVDQEALKKAIEERPDDFVKLFTTPKDENAANGTTEQGIIHRIKDVFDKYAATTGEHKGSIVTMAGIKGSSLIKETKLSKQIEDIEKQITKLEASLKTAQDRYYRQFTSLESYIAKMSAQSSWLMSLYDS